MQRSNRAEGEKEEANSLKSRGLWRGLRKIWRDVLICDTVASCDRQYRLYSGRLIPSFFILLYRVEGCKPNKAAAPSSPFICQLAALSTSKM